MLEKLVEKINNDYGMNLSYDSFVKYNDNIFIAEDRNTRIIAKRLKWGRWKILFTN